MKASSSDQPPIAGPLGHVASDRHRKAGPARAASVYKDVRSLSRGLAIIEALGAAGWMKLGPLSAITGIDRTTVYRLVNTLEEDGYVTRRTEDGAVNLSRKLLNIGQNLNNEDLVAQVVLRHLWTLTQAIKWPSDFAVLSQGALRIVASTHNKSPMSIHRAMVGNTRPLFRSALGKAYLAALPEDELTEIMAIIGSGGGPDAADLRAVEPIRRSLAEVREAGFAAAVGTTEAKISAIALPVRQTNTVVGAINVIFFRGALTPEQAVEKYLSRMQATVAAIERELVEALAHAYVPPDSAESKHSSRDRNRRYGGRG